MYRFSLLLLAYISHTQITLAQKRAAAQAAFDRAFWLEVGIIIGLFLSIVLYFLALALIKAKQYFLDNDPLVGTCAKVVAVEELDEPGTRRMTLHHQELGDFQIDIGSNYCIFSLVDALEPNTTDT